MAIAETLVSCMLIDGLPGIVKMNMGEEDADVSEGSDQLSTSSDYE